MHELTSESIDMSRGIWRHRSLILMLARRDIVGRYRGSMLGVAWSLIYPLFMLAIYSFVFGGIFKSHWGSGGSSPLEFSLVLFLGLIVFNIFSESVSRAPGVIVAHGSYVKKIVFPLEILPVVVLAGAMFQFLVSLVVWLVFCGLFLQIPPLTIVLLPVAILPLLLFTLGACWVLAALGAYLRDIGHLAGILVTALLFLSPIFYPVTALPERLRHLMYFNPLAEVIENVRLVAFWSRLPEPGTWCLSLLAGVLAAWLGLGFFQKARGGFADVL